MVGFPRIGELRRSVVNRLTALLVGWTVWDGVRDGILKTPAIILMDSDTALAGGHDRPPFFVWQTTLTFYIVGGPEGEPRSWENLPDLISEALGAIQEATQGALGGEPRAIRARIPGETIPIAGSNYHLGLVEVSIIHSI